MTHPENRQYKQDTDHLERALESARQLTTSIPGTPVSTEWMQAAQHAGDLAVLALALQQ